MDQVLHMQAGISRLTAAIGRTPSISLEEGLAQTAAWARAQSA